MVSKASPKRLSENLLKNCGAALPTKDPKITTQIKGKQPEYHQRLNVGYSKIQMRSFSAAAGPGQPTEEQRLI